MKYKAFISGKIHEVEAESHTKALLIFAKISDEITPGEIWSKDVLPRQWAASYKENGISKRVEVTATTKVLAWRKIGVGKVKFSDIILVRK